MTPQTTSLTPEPLAEVVIRFAGDSGDGMQLTGDRFTDVSAAFGNDLATLPNYPAEIRAPAGTIAGVSSFQVQISDHEILTPGDLPTVLVAMNPAALRANMGRDRRVLWHPYAPATRATPLFGVVDACGTTLTLDDGRTVVDGMSSWWAAVHGYRHPVLDAALHLVVEEVAEHVRHRRHLETSLGVHRDRAHGGERCERRPQALGVVEVQRRRRVVERLAVATVHAPVEVLGLQGEPEVRREQPQGDDLHHEHPGRGEEDEAGSRVRAQRHRGSHPASSQSHRPILPRGSTAPGARQVRSR